MEYIIIDNNQDFAKALYKQLSKNGVKSKEGIVPLAGISEVSELADNVNPENDKIVIFVNLNLILNNCNRQNQKGIELLAWLRIKGVMNHVVLYSFESLETILKKEEKNLMLISRGTSFVRLPSDFANLENMNLSQKANKKNVWWILNEIYIAGLKHFGQNKFYIENIWKSIVENESASIKSLETEVGKFLIGHNENITIENIEDLKNKILSYDVQKLNIDIILCDDHAENKINETDFNKKEIIVKNLDLLDLKCFNILTCKNLESLYKSKDCDIILLDYKLGDDENGKKETGTQYFIDRQETGINIKEKHQFLGKNWVLPISYLSNEMIEDFRENNVAFTENNLVLSLGADPISQPYRFLYELLYILNEQLKRAIGWTIEDNFMEYLKKANDLIEFIKGCKEINREGTKNLFSEVSTLFHRIHTIKNNKREGLYQSLNNKIKDEEKKIEILSLYRDLLYQLSFMKHEDNELLFFLLTDLEDCLKNYSQKDC